MAAGVGENPKKKLSSAVLLNKISLPCCFLHRKWPTIDFAPTANNSYRKLFNSNAISLSVNGQIPLK